MATKKQKREENLARRERHLAAERQVGLDALQKDRENRARKNLEFWQGIHDNKHSWKKRDTKCPHCQVILKVAKRPQLDTLRELIDADRVAN